MIKKLNLFVITLCLVVGFSIFAGGCGDNSMVGIEITPPNKVEYFVGEQFDSTGLVVKAVYKKGDKEVVETGYTLSLPDMNTAGLKEVKVNYSDKEASFKIRIKEPTLTGISVSGSLTNTTQEQGEPFDATGISFNAVYDNGYSESIDIANIEFVSTNLDERHRFINVDANTEITVKYNDMQASQKLIVNVVAPTAQRKDVTFNKNTTYTVNDMPADKRVVLGDTVGTVFSPSLKGFEFAGWYTEAECTNKWVMDTATVSDNVELFAKWNAKTYNVKYMVAGEELAGSNITSYTAEEGEFKNVILVAVSKPHYDFLGWYLDEDCVENKIEKLSYGLLPDEGSEIVVYAKLDKTAYSVNFNLLEDNADCTLAWTEGFEAVATYTYGQTVNLPTAENLVLSSIAYKFDGWYLEGDDIQTVVTTISAEEGGNKNFVAKISLKPTYNITFNANGGKFEDETETSSVEVIEGQFATKPADPVREGYVFAGWYVDDNKFNFESEITANTNATAKWLLVVNDVEPNSAYLVGVIANTNANWSNKGFKMTKEGTNGGQYVLTVSLSAGDTFKFIITGNNPADGGSYIIWRDKIETGSIEDYIKNDAGFGQSSNITVVKSATFTFYVKINENAVYVTIA